jgi:hypothetical protein
MTFICVDCKHYDWTKCVNDLACASEPVVEAKNHTKNVLATIYIDRLIDLVKEER